MSRHPMNDVIVVLPGILGSTLHRDGTPLWAPTPRAVLGALASAFASITQLHLPQGIGDDHPGDGVEAGELMRDLRLPLGLWTFDLGYSALLNFLRRTFDLTEPTPNDHADGPPANLVTFPYDWRLSNRYNGQRLQHTAERALDQWRNQDGPRRDAQLVFICHSMGGLVARWYLDHLGGTEHTRKLITLGTPHRGALNALDQLINGIRKGPGPFKLNLTHLARSLPSVHQLLPEYACLARGGTLAKITQVQLPELDTQMVNDAFAFHHQIDTPRANGANNASGYDLHPILGFDQPTWTTGQLDDHRLYPLHTISGNDERGDATVPRLAAVPPDLATDNPVLKYVADNHAGLVHNTAVFDEIEGILTANPVRHLGDDIRLALDIPEILDPGEPLPIRAELPGEEPVALEALAIHTQHGLLGPPVRLTTTHDSPATQIHLPHPGTYHVTVRGAGTARHRVSSITTAVLAWPPEPLLDLPDPAPQP